MLFTHDTEVYLQFLAALVNTAAGSEELATPFDLDVFRRTWGFTDRTDGDEAELRAVRRLRGPLRSLFVDDEEQVAEGINRLLRQGRAVPHVVRHGGWGWHLHATDAQQPLATRMAVGVAMALVDVLRSGQLDRLRICEAPQCERVLVDLSRNRCRRFCSTTCGNRMAVAAYRARRSDRAG